MYRRTFVLLAVACAISTSIDAQTISKRKLEGITTDILEQRTGLRVSVQCPLQTQQAVGERAVCTATGPEGEPFSVELIQTDSEGGISFTITDSIAMETLEPLAQSFFEDWKSEDFEGIYADAHTSFTETIRLEDLSALLQCTSADLEGLVGTNEPEAAVIHRGDGSAQIFPSFQFGAGTSRATLSYQMVADGWQLTGLDLPVLEIDYSTVSQETFVAEASSLLAAADAEDWTQVEVTFSHELRRDSDLEEVRRNLADPWDLGPVERISLTSFARNRARLPMIVTQLTRERGEHNAMFVFRSCGDEWKLRYADGLPPGESPPAVEIRETTVEIITALQQNGIEATLSCPGTVFTQVPGIVYTCEAEHASGITAPLEVRVGQDGGLSWELLAGPEWDSIIE